MKNIPNSQLVTIEQEISQLILDLNKAADWTTIFLKEDIKKKTNDKIKKIRRDLKKIRFAITQNPSAALYGESQVGKSYLIKNLLSESGKAFTILNEATGEKYDFLERINPKGDQTEATSIVTRFSTNVKVIDPAFPIKVRLLSPKDLILLLADSYFSDVVDHISLPDSKQIEEHIQSLEDLLSASSHKQQVFTEDDVYDIREYLEQNFRSFTTNLVNSPFWDYCAAQIEKVAYSDWYKLFEIIWGRNEHINAIFRKLVETSNKIAFAEEIYTGFKTVLRDHGTLLHVARLREFNGPRYEDVPREKYLSTVEIMYEGATGKNFNTIDKSVLCALTAELIFKVDKVLENEKPFLASSDLLDFPGARSRLENQENKLSEEHIGNMVLRGKVSYIFNKYSSQYLISNLLFCNKNAKIEVKYIPKLLNNWIENYIGKDPQKRQAFLSSTSLPPLFIIYTFFNEDMKFNSINDKEKTLSEKWIKRFRTIFENEIITEDYNWHTAWSADKPYFQNNYMLRDFHHSDAIYSGYSDEDNKEKAPIQVKMQGYLKKLKKSFIEFEFVKKHFANPEASWDEAASMNKDGSEPIIRNLAKVSNNHARTQKFIRELNLLSQELKEEMHKHYHSDEIDKQIKIANQKAGIIHGNMDDVFGRDPYAFGNFIKSFTIKESVVYNLFKELLNGVDLIKHKNINSYILYRNSNPTLNSKKSYEENIAVLDKTYKLGGQEAVELFFEEKNIDLNELFYGELNNLKNSSQVLAEALRDYWFTQHLKKERFEAITNNGFSAVALENLFENIKVSFNELEITKKIAEEIREYVDRYEQLAEAVEMIADIGATIINKFITSMGWDYYTPARIERIQKTNTANKLDLNFEFTKAQTTFMDNAEISVLFDNMSNYNTIINERSFNHEAVKHFPNIRNIARWRDLMKISFIANCEIPTYDPMANTALGKVLENLEKHHFALASEE